MPRRRLVRHRTEVLLEAPPSLPGVPRLEADFTVTHRGRGLRVVGEVADWTPHPPEVLQAIKPKLTIARVSGYGQTGPMSTLPAFDSILQARVGLADGAKADDAKTNGLA